jgi:hypothetical protein
VLPSSRRDKQLCGGDAIANAPVTALRKHRNRPAARFDAEYHVLRLSAGKDITTSFAESRSPIADNYDVDR